MQQWLVCAVAALGFCFDTYEILMLPLVVGPALSDLGGLRPGTPEFNAWAGWLFWAPALAGGAFGLLGGWLTDRFGRQRVLVWSILLYACSALAAGFATTLAALLVLRCATFVGACVEFVAAVAWLAELFDEPRRREAVVGYTQAFSSMGGVAVTTAYYLAVTYGHHLPAIQNTHAAWRYTLISGVLPALPLIVIRPFLPESPTWLARRAAGTLKRPHIRELFAPAFRRTTVVTTVVVACVYALSFAGIQQVPRMVPGLPEVVSASRAVQQQTVSVVQGWQEAGGVAGRLVLAFLAVRVVGRRRLLHLFQVPALLIIPLVFFLPAKNDLDLFKYGIALTGLLTIGQMSFFGNYLPRVYPTYLRGTGEAFAANIGGRMVGTSAAYVVTQLANITPGDSSAHQLANASTIVVLAVCVAGLIASRWLPEPVGQQLPE